MTSGVKVSDDAKECVDKMAVHLSKDDKMERYKILFFTIDDAIGEIVVDHANSVKVKDVANQDPFKILQDKIMAYKGCYALYDCHYETNETEKTELVRIMWAPDSSTVKIKMKYASSKESFKLSLGACGIKHNWDINDEADIKDRSILVDKLGEKIKKLEGKDLV